MKTEKKEAKKEKVKKIIPLLKKMHPQAHCELDHRNPLELLIATILSAQCTDKRVNQVTPHLYKKYPLAKDYAESVPGELEGEIKSTGFFRNKAKMIREATRELATRFGGKVPDRLEDLITLPGIGRKTANVILGTAFGVPGIVVDTHVLRVSERLGLTKNTDPAKVEVDLMEIVPKKAWIDFSYLLVFQGRYTCNARKPLCGQCSLPPYCDYFQKSLPLKR
ncbi:MAG: endonuclease III [Thermodesulfobacteriota bacterium]|nr:MAG: endonuclease III [Thermodesulfobacteriota bacterium]